MVYYLVQPSLMAIHFGMGKTVKVSVVLGALPLCPRSALATVEEVDTANESVVFPLVKFLGNEFVYSSAQDFGNFSSLPSSAQVVHKTETQIPNLGTLANSVFCCCE